jgi:hypothetical protein
LMTYGWALLVVLLVISALAYFGVLSPGNLIGERCGLAPPLSCEDFIVGDTGVLLTVANNGFSAIELSSLDVSSSELSSCLGTPVGDTTIPAGESRSITAPCSITSTGKQAYSFTLAYTLLGSSLEHHAGGDLVAEVQQADIDQVCADQGGNCLSGQGSVSYDTCNELHLAQPGLGDGTYQLSVGNVFCDMTTAGGGWTRIDFASDLPHINRWTTGDGWKWLPSNFQTVLSSAQIQTIQAKSTEGWQNYYGTCQDVIHWYYTSGGTYTYAFGFRFLNGQQTNYGTSNLGVPNTVLQDGCAANDGTLRQTEWKISDVRVPIVNVYSRDNGQGREQFGSPLTQYHAWLR